MMNHSLPLHMEENGIPYTLHGDVYLPDLKISSDPRPIGRYGRLHLDYLRDQHPVRYNLLILSEDYPRLLADLNEDAHNLLHTVIRQMAAAEGVTEDLKRRDAMAWIGAMNNIRARAEEIVLHDLIYV